MAERSTRSVPGLDRRAGGPGWPVAATLVAITLLHGLVVAWLLDRPGGAAWRPTSLGSLTWAPIPAPPSTGPALAAVPRRPGALGPLPLPAESTVAPVGLVIPSIGVDEPTLVRLGRGADGTLEVPSEFARAGWFTGGPAPGGPGPAVIAGHVDSRSGPAVFYRLRELRPGDLVTVRLADGGQAPFVVDGVERYPKNAFPTDAVYGPVPGRALRLITCGGGFDRAAGSYRDNIVVYASQH